MARLERPHPPGDYPAVIVGSGPGGLQVSYSLTRLGINHAVISRDAKPGGMFQRFPVFQRLISWSKPYAPVPRQSRAYEWFDWNSLLADEPQNRGFVPDLMDGSSYFPARSEMEAGLALFAERTGLEVRYECSWEATRRTGNGFELLTSDGEYRCKVVVFAIGTTTPWKPEIEGIESVPHYADVKPARSYADKRVFIIGKRNSGFELADGLLPWASRIILASPRPARLSVITRSLVGARARYVQPYEDHVLGGGNIVLDAAIERVIRNDAGCSINVKGTATGLTAVFESDEVIAATGFQTPLQDLRELGVATVAQDRIPAQTPYWESVSVPGIYFAGSATQGATELKKHGVPSSSAAVQGFRYNARVLAGHIAAKHFGRQDALEELKSKDVVGRILDEATESGELWNQKGYLAHIVEFIEGRIVNRGIQPLSYFVDSPGPEAVAVTVESDARSDIHPTAYIRRSGRVDEHLLEGSPEHDFRTAAHRKQLASILAGMVD